jgi:hypothetical protein
LLKGYDLSINVSALCLTEFRTAGSSNIRVIEFFIHFIILAARWQLARLSFYQKFYSEYLLGGERGVKGGRCLWLTTLPLSGADCVEMSGISTFWSPKCLSNPV